MDDVTTLETSFCKSDAAIISGARGGAGFTGVTSGGGGAFGFGGEGFGGAGFGLAGDGEGPSPIVVAALMASQLSL